MAKKMGRPIMSPNGERKRHAFGVRTTETLKDKITASAVEAGRSIACELEHRIERSFERDDLRAILREEIRALVRDEVRMVLREEFARQADRGNIPGERTEDEPSQRPQ